MEVQFVWQQDFIKQYMRCPIYHDKYKIKIFVDHHPHGKKEKNHRWVFLQVESGYLLNRSKKINKLMRNNSNIDLLLVFDQKLLNLPNSVFFTTYAKSYYVNTPMDLEEDNCFFNYLSQRRKLKNFNESWLKRIDYKPENKKFKISMMCGVKKYLVGHIMRHKIWNMQNQISNIPIVEFYYNAGDKKIKKYATSKPIGLWRKNEIIEESKFHVCVENNRSKNYFTEKFIDCIATKTVPIYWGCNNIGDFFDLQGIIIIKDDKDFIKKVGKITNKTYNNMLPYVLKNYETWKKMPSFHTQVVDALKRFD